MDLKTQPCPSCGGTMTRGVQPETITLGGHSLTYQQPGWHCADCDDGIIEGADNEAADDALYRLKEVTGMAVIKIADHAETLIRRHVMGHSDDVLDEEFFKVCIALFGVDNDVIPEADWYAFVEKAQTDGWEVSQAYALSQGYDLSNQGLHLRDWELFTAMIRAKELGFFEPATIAANKLRIEAEDFARSKEEGVIKG